MSFTRSPVSADDPQALDKLTAYHAELEAKHARMLKVNEAHKAFLKNPTSLDASDLTEEEKRIVRTYQPRYRSEPHPHAPYTLKSSKANIKRVAERIETLKHQAGRESREETVEAVSLTIRYDAQENRIVLLFPKPSAEVRKRLKRVHGFLWSPTRTGWVRQWTDNGEAAARTFRDELVRAAAATVTDTAA